MNRFHKGDHVRVKDEATLRAEISRSGHYMAHRNDGDWFASARGLSWIPEMWEYCGTDFILTIQDEDDDHWWQFFCKKEADGSLYDRVWLFDEDWLEPYEDVQIPAIEVNMLL